VSPDLTAICANTIWHVSRLPPRDLFSGNIRPGEALRIELIGLSPE
jgi:hypothetical protein